MNKAIIEIISNGEIEVSLDNKNMSTEDIVKGCLCLALQLSDKDFVDVVLEELDNEFNNKSNIC